MKTFVPKPFHVFLTIDAAHSTNGKDWAHRIGAASTVEAAKELIAKDKRGFDDSCGGLFARSSNKGRTYHIFQAEWTKIEI